MTLRTPTAAEVEATDPTACLRRIARVKDGGELLEVRENDPGSYRWFYRYVPVFSNGTRAWGQEKTTYATVHPDWAAREAAGDTSWVQEWVAVSASRRLAWAEKLLDQGLDALLLS